MTLVVNARMYAVTQSAKAAWDALFAHLATATGLPLERVEHPFPLPVSDLWKRPDLACAFMCGWPWVRGGALQQPIAAPVPKGEAAPVYHSDLVVRAAHPSRALADLEGARIGYTLLDSQSGFSALRTHLRTVASPPRFSAAIGPLATPRRSIEAVIEGRADIAPIDSYAHALLRRHDPALTTQVRILTRTKPTPIPLLVASPAADPAIAARLRDALLAITSPALLEPLCLERFAAPLPQAAYQAMETDARAAEQAGLHDLTPFLQTEPA